jgi:hypothetical protein
MKPFSSAVSRQDRASCRQLFIAEEINFYEVLPIESVEDFSTVRCFILLEKLAVARIAVLTF